MIMDKAIHYSVDSVDSNELHCVEQLESASSDDDEDLVDAGGLSTDQCQAIGTSSEHHNMNMQISSVRIEVDRQNEKRASGFDQPYRTVEFATQQRKGIESGQFSEQEVREQKLMLREIRRQNRSTRVELHKLHLLCLVSSIRIRNILCNSSILQAVALSVVPHALHSEKVSILLLWFRATFVLTSLEPTFQKTIMEKQTRDTQFHSSQEDVILVEEDDVGSMKGDRIGRIQVNGNSSSASSDLRADTLATSELITVLQTKRGCETQLTEAWVVICRSLGHIMRLVWSLDPLPQQRPRNMQQPVAARSKRRRISDDGSSSATVTNESSLANHSLTLDQVYRSSLPTSGTFSELLDDSGWTTIDCLSGMVNQPLKIEERFDREVTYAVAIDNTGAVKDVTQRYARNWLTTTTSHRYAASWWASFLETLKIDCAEKYASNEESQLDHTVQAAANIPQSFSTLKKHRLYVLQRHLRHDQVLHPRAEPVGMAKSEPVYFRSQVHSVKSRDAWFREARVVVSSAVPVKTRARRATASSHAQKERCTDASTLNIDLYGQWQTHEYIPPIAKNGIVPRNAFGNVDLFQPVMMPQGCVLVDDPKAQGVARELGIDCARAVVGFEHRMGTSVPQLSKGCIVCDEFEDVLVAAVANQRQIDAEKAVKTRMHKVCQRWRRLVRAALIRLAVVQHWEDE
eukprot:m.238220 g.238220  ORF g.238220 m.238220 type:complete len:687 (-) comp19385_c0_seq1:288-2348(-)